jgi:hypothetical protein
MTQQGSTSTGTAPDNTRLDCARRAGYEAAVAGNSRVPALCKTFHNLVAELPVGGPLGSSIPIANAWIEGYQQRCNETASSILAHPDAMTPTGGQGSAELRFREDAEAQALLDFDQAKGQIIEVETVTGYVGNSHDQTDRTAPNSVPFRVRVIDTSPEEVKHWNDDWLDPYWNVEPAEGETRLADLRSIYTFGHSYRTQRS